MDKATRTRLSIYLSLVSAIIVTLVYIQLRSITITGDEAAGYFDGCLQSLTETAKTAMGKQESGRPVLKEMLVISLKGRQLRKLHRRIKRSLNWTERRLKRIGASKEIKGRHRLFVAEFESNVKSLSRRIGSLTGHYWGGLAKGSRRAQFKEELGELVDFLEEREPELVDIPLDPHKLPHRLAPKVSLHCLEYQEGVRGSVQGIRAPPAASDLRETIEIKFTKAMKELARELKGSPVEIYDYVRNTLDYEPYHGSLKGAERTLLEKAGNDFDLASLLISLLRCSGIPSRYVHGEVVVPIPELMSWMGGVRTASTAVDILGASGIPAVVLVANDDTVAVRMAHCWVEAFVDGTRWVTLDPSFRRYTHHVNLDVSRDVVFDEEAYLEFLKDRRRWKRFLPVMSRRSPPVRSIPSPSAFYRDQVRDFIETRHALGSVSDAMGKRTCEPRSSEGLSETLPLEVTRIVSTFSEVPDSLRHRLYFGIIGLRGKRDLTHDVSTPELGAEPVLLLYLPATEDDEKLAEAYGSIYSPLAYLLEVRPHLRIGGSVVATGSAIRFGESQILEIVFVPPGGSGSDSIEIEVVAGAAICPVFDYQRISMGFAAPYIDDALSLLEGEESQEEDSALPDADVIERFLHGFGMWYFSELDDCDRMLRGILHIVNAREVSLQMLAYDASVVNLFGVPYDVDMGNIFNDIYRIVNRPFSVFGDEAQRERYNVISGYESSFLMQDVYERWLERRSFCAVEVLQMAKQRGIPVHTVSIENVDRVIPRLRLSDDMKEKIRDMADAGRTILVPQEEIVVHKWQGIGYVAMDPATGDGAYKVRRERDAQVLAPGSGRLIFEYSTVLIAAVVAAWTTWRVRRRRRARVEQERRRTGGPLPFPRNGMV